MGRINVTHGDFVTPRRLARATAAICGAATLALLGGSSIAAAAAGDQCDNAAIREVQGSTWLPDCRAFEWVSYNNLGGYLAGVDAGLRPKDLNAAADGSKLLFFASGPLGNADRGAIQVQQFGERTEDGWAVRPGLTLTSPEAMADALTTTQLASIPSSDFSAYGFQVGRTLGPPNPINIGGSLYISRGANDTDWISQPEAGLPVVATGGSVLGGNADFSTVYFLTSRVLTTQAGDDARNGIGLYERTNGVTRPAGVLPNGTVPPGGIKPAGSGTFASSSGLNTAMLKRRNQVSEDGRRVFFTAAATAGGPDQLYVREDGARTRLLSHALGSPRTPSAEGVTGFPYDINPPAGQAYATVDGRYVLFASTDVLVTGADPAATGFAPNFYRADVATGALTYLPEIRGTPVMVDADASRILWYERLLPGEGHALHIWDGDGNVRRTLKIHPPGSVDLAGAPWGGVHTTADGSIWSIQTKLALDPAFPDTANTSQVYRWKIGDAAPKCISCRAGAAFAGNASMTAFAMYQTETLFAPSATTPGGLQIPTRAMSEDGRRTVFDTRVALLDEDVNRWRDIYLWEEGRGLSLISTGKEESPSWFLDASASLDDIFFTTTADLVPDDGDESYDVYTAHVGGGFAPKLVPDCDGDGCQPPGIGLTPPSAPGSDQVGAASNGPDDIAPSPAQISVKRVTRDRTGATLRIATSSAGTVQVTGRRLATIRRTLTDRGALTVRLRLSRAAKRTLARHGRVKVTTRVRFAPSSGRAVATTVTTTIKRKR